MIDKDAMDELKESFQQMLDQDLIQIVLSNSRNEAQGIKVKIRPVMIKGGLRFQETIYRGTKVFHSNHEKEEMQERLCDYMQNLFRQAQMIGASEIVTALVSKKGAVSVKHRRTNRDREQAQKPKDLSHDRSKRYILQEGQPVDFLIGLGVQTPDGHIVRAKYDKFRQINRYLEFIEDILDKLPDNRTIRIVDFGCGKSYLTFAMYYYLCRLSHRDIKVTGLDLKADVIEHCNRLAEKLGYDRLGFCQGDIGSFQETEPVDMVVTLHACDKATDYALEKAVKWGAAIIMAVPCCQHELNGQISCEELKPVLRYGVIKERMAALITDALRADLLECNGYDVQILEFIDMEHTPKNLMIRAVRSSRMRPKNDVQAAALDRTMEFLHVNPVLKELL